MAITLLVGGARSGKSDLAVRMAAAQDAPVVVIATGEPRDEEMAERIDRHRRERPPAWTTIEEPLDLAGALAKVDTSACVLVDCLTLWVSNLLERETDAVEILGVEAARIAADRPGPTIVVSNEVGSGVVPADPATRAYRDALGRVNAAWAAVAERAYLLVAGRAIELAPVDGLIDD
jgi:adenosyl cobinamide kinase/adenosyl cobinamide phosphate guanylyltransferase